jgi:hypothetical protein
VKIFVGARHAVPSWGKKVLEILPNNPKKVIFSFLVKRLDIGVFPLGTAYRAPTSYVMRRIILLP